MDEKKDKFSFIANNKSSLHVAVKTSSPIGESVNGIAHGESFGGKGEVKVDTLAMLPYVKEFGFAQSFAPAGRECHRAVLVL